MLCSPSRSCGRVWLPRTRPAPGVKIKKKVDVAPPQPAHAAPTSSRTVTTDRVRTSSGSLGRTAETLDELSLPPRRAALPAASRLWRPPRGHASRTRHRRSARPFIDRGIDRDAVPCLGVPAQATRRRDNRHDLPRMPRSRRSSCTDDLAPQVSHRYTRARGRTHRRCARSAAAGPHDWRPRARTRIEVLYNASASRTRALACHCNGMWTGRCRQAEAA